MKSEALLAGRIFDDRDNRMTPSHVRKRGIKYRYYLSSALLQGQPDRAGAVSRIPAIEIEGLVMRSVRATSINLRRYRLQAVAKPQYAEGAVAQDATQTAA
jgi:hypothetical protein